MEKEETWVSASTYVDGSLCPGVVVGEFIGNTVLRSRVTVWLPWRWGFLIVQLQTSANGVGWFLFHKNLGCGPEEVR